MKLATNTIIIRHGQFVDNMGSPLDNPPTKDYP